MKHKHLVSLEIAAARSGMSIKTARKYFKCIGSIANEDHKTRTHRTRIDPFKQHWSEINTMLIDAPELQAKTILAYLINKYPAEYNEQHLRTLQRRLQEFHILYGKDKAVMFLQDIKAGQSSQSDWTDMSSLNINIDGKHFEHLIFHFMLPYSRWESIMVCYTESFDTLTQGFEKAVWELGGSLSHHRTDNLSAATQKFGNSRTFTVRWQEFLGYYNVTPTRNNPGVSNENGSVEKSHDTFKNAVKQHLLLRGSNNFSDLQSYEFFLNSIREARNKSRHLRLAEELPLLQELPSRKWRDPISLNVRVSPSSIVNILGVTYSVPSRFISYSLRADVYLNTIELYYGGKKILDLSRMQAGNVINYRHIIDSLLRKPGAFNNYQYREHLFPHLIFRKAYDELIAAAPTSGHKEYLRLLQLAKIHGEQQVIAALELCVESHKTPMSSLIKEYLDIPTTKAMETTVLQPNIAIYDALHTFVEEVQNV